MEASLARAVLASLHYSAAHLSPRAAASATPARQWGHLRHTNLARGSTRGTSCRGSGRSFSSFLCVDARHTPHTPRCRPTCVHDFRATFGLFPPPTNARSSSPAAPYYTPSCTALTCLAFRQCLLPSNFSLSACWYPRNGKLKGLRFVVVFCGLVWPKTRLTP